MAHVTKVEDFTPQGFRWVSLKKLWYTDSKGKGRSWEMAQRIVVNKGEGEVICNGVGIIAIIEYSCKAREDHILLVSQFRPPINKMVLEVPAGLVDEGEDAGAAALRELKEETGYKGVVTHQSPIVYSDPGLTDASMRYVHVRVDGDHPANYRPVPTPDEGESITVHTVPVRTLLDHINMFKDKGYEIDARLYGLAYGMSLTHTDSSSSSGKNSRICGPCLPKGLTVTLMVVLTTYLTYWFVRGRHTKALH